MTVAAQDWAGAEPVELIARRASEKRTATLLRVTSITLFFAIWYAVAILNAHVVKYFNPLLLPAPHTVLYAGIEMVRSGELQRDIVASMSRVVQGFILAALVGVT